MASFAKESLSPLLTNANVRRRSLDLCQKLGNQLLSPNTTLLLSPSPTKANNTATKHKNESSSPSPFKLSPVSSPVFNYSYDYNETTTASGATPSTSYHYKRRASDSLWIDTFPKEETVKENEQFQKRRLSFSFQEQAEEPLKGPTKSTETGEKVLGQDGSLNLKTSKSEIPKIACNIIPPTPLKQVEPRASKMHPPSPVKFSMDHSETDDSEDAMERMLGKDKDVNGNHTNIKLGSSHLVEVTPGTNVSLNSKQRRCSSGAKYDLDESLIKFVTTRWDLSLNPDELLGKGSFGTVVGGSYKGKQVAVKILKTTNKQKKASIVGEDNALHLPFHKHIARIMDILYVNPDRTLIIMEKMQKGSLLNLLNDPSFKVNCSIAISISKQIALALVFCHRLGILHLDVKPQNILVDEFNCCKLSDFGNSKKLSNLDAGQKYSTLDGTVPYTAPELFKGSQPTEKCDVYSFGITMWQILTREMPYGSENQHTVIFRVVSQGLRPNITNNPVDVNGNNRFPIEERSLTSGYARIYERAWSGDPHLRPIMTDIHKDLIEIQLF